MRSDLALNSPYLAHGGGAAPKPCVGMAKDMWRYMERYGILTFKFPYQDIGVIMLINLDTGIPVA